MGASASKQHGGGKVQMKQDGGGKVSDGDRGTVITGVQCGVVLSTCEHM